MAEGYEGKIGIKEQYNGWGNAAVLPGIGVFEPDSANPDTGIVQNRRSSKIRGQRNVAPANVTKDFANPTSEFTIQPRVLEMIPLLMSHYQCVEVVNGTNISGNLIVGTFRFAPANRTPDSSGNSWGTFWSPSGAGGGGTAFSVSAGDFYPLTIEVGVGTISDTAPEAQFVFPNGYVEQMSWEQEWDGDLMVTARLNRRGS